MQESIQTRGSHLNHTKNTPAKAQDDLDHPCGGIAASKGQYAAESPHGLRSATSNFF